MTTNYSPYSREVPSGSCDGTGREVGDLDGQDWGLGGGLDGQDWVLGGGLDGQDWGLGGGLDGQDWVLGSRHPQSGYMKHVCNTLGVRAHRTGTGFSQSTQLVWDLGEETFITKII